MFGFLKKLFGTAQTRMVGRYRKIVRTINEHEEKYQRLSDDEIRAKTDEFKRRVAQGESLDDVLPEAYAVVKNVCRRLLGTEVHVSGYDQKWDMVPFDVQLIGAIAMHNGTISEMQTGEGKTLTAVLPLYLNALTGKPVHLVTVNDYLAERDCQWVGAVLRWLGLTTGALTNNVSPYDRAAIYASDVVYGTASEFGFDYLRDNSMAQRKEEQVQRGHYFAIIDELDSILIDEARTPLIISGPVPVSRQMYDTLKGGVGVLIRYQKDLCNRLATEAQKVISGFGYTRDESPEKMPNDEGLKEAFRKLWLVSKGTPRHQVLKKLMENPDVRAAIDEWDLYYYNDQNKEEKADALAALYMIIDEKASEYELTDQGILAWSKTSEEASSDDFVMLDLGHEYSEVEKLGLTEEDLIQKKSELQQEDSIRKERAHNLRQLLRAHLLMEKDVDYIVQDQKIVIIDENTGRPQPGRRFSDGLHQAIEAKEGVKVQKETQTYATITLQNYFRMYGKLAGMSGTAVTEATEFKEIYSLEVLEIPTHRPCQRIDEHDEIYMTEREKYQAILDSVKEVHAKGRPILIGTETVEVSEKLSRIFTQKGLRHSVLNAKHHDREAEIIADAGQHSSITIATNMAGRGTDIKLGEGVADLGGLHVIGTARQNARRIDRQLRGRCARLGDPGSTRFYLSFEDSLLRHFASGIAGALQRMRPPEGEAISSSLVTRSIETAQKRVEQRNYQMRKHTLEYDDVMNKQRQEIYSFRNSVLRTEDPVSIAHELIDTVCVDQAHEYYEQPKPDVTGYLDWIYATFPVALPEVNWDRLSPTKAGEVTSKSVVEAFDLRVQAERAKIEHIEDQEDPVNDAVRGLILRKLDQKWQEHLLAMDHLRTEVGLRRYSQRDPLIEFKHEAFQMFGELSHDLRRDVGSSLFKFRIVPVNPHALEELLAKMSLEKDRSLVDEEPNKTAPVKPMPVQAEERVGRNDPCPCGSGKKYKQCHGAKAAAVED